MMIASSSSDETPLMNPPHPPATVIVKEEPLLLPDGPPALAGEVLELSGPSTMEGNQAASDSVKREGPSPPVVAKVVAARPAVPTMSASTGSALLHHLPLYRLPTQQPVQQNYVKVLPTAATLSIAQKASELINPQGESKRCNCRKSRCLKLYCECFAANVLCKGCKCIDCHNTPEHEGARLKAIEYKLTRRPRAFEPKFQATSGTVSASSVNLDPVKHSRGCNCKKSACEKKYCECYQNGVACSSICKCTQCKNDGSLPHLRNFGVVEWRNSSLVRADFEHAAKARPAHPADFVPGLEVSFTFVPYHVAQQQAQAKAKAALKDHQKEHQRVQKKSTDTSRNAQNRRKRSRAGVPNGTNKRPKHSRTRSQDSLHSIRPPPALCPFAVDADLLCPSGVNGLPLGDFELCASLGAERSPTSPSKLGRGPNPHLEDSFAFESENELQFGTAVGLADSWGGDLGAALAGALAADGAGAQKSSLRGIPEGNMAMEGMDSSLSPSQVVLGGSWKSLGGLLGSLPSTLKLGDSFKLEDSNLKLGDSWKSLGALGGSASALSLEGQLGDSGLLGAALSALQERPVGEGVGVGRQNQGVSEVGRQNQGVSEVVNEVVNKVEASACDVNRVPGPTPSSASRDSSHSDDTCEDSPRGEGAGGDLHSMGSKDNKEESKEEKEVSSPERGVQGVAGFPGLGTGTPAPVVLKDFTDFSKFAWGDNPEGEAI